MYTLFSAPEISQAKDASSVKDKESSYLADLLDEDYLNMNNPDIWNIPCPSEPMAKPMESSMTPVLTNTSNLNWGPPPMATWVFIVSTVNGQWLFEAGFHDAISSFKLLKNISIYENY